MANKTNDADVLKFFNDLQAQRNSQTRGSIIEGRETPTEKDPRRPRWGDDDSPMYAKHVKRALARHKKQAYRRQQRDIKSAKREGHSMKRESTKRENQRERQKKVHNWFAGSKKRRAERKAKRSNKGEGGGWTCTPESC